MSEVKQETATGKMMGSKELNLEPKAKRVLGLIRGLRAERILDVGCGTGDFSTFLAEALRAAEIYGVEISADATKQAKEKGINCIRMDIDVADFPFDNNYFSAIYCGDIIEHLSCPDHLLSELHRVLKPGGWCIITTPNLSSWHSRLHLLLGYQPYPIPVRSSRSNRTLGSFLSPVRGGHSYLDCSGRAGRGHVQFFTLRALKELLQLHGLKLLNVSGSPDIPLFHIPAALSWLVLLIEKLVSAYFPGLASRLIIRATK